MSHTLLSAGAGRLSLWLGGATLALGTFLRLSSATSECTRLRSQAGHKPYFEVTGSSCLLKVKMLQKPRPARVL